MIRLGVDEVGRGCWAGPLVAAAVVLDRPIMGLNDSKQLTRVQREKLAAEIVLRASAHSLGWVTSAEFNLIGLSRSVKLAMERAVFGIGASYQEIIVDGNINYLDHLPNSRALIRADTLIPDVSAASILAKVSRDQWMRQYAHQKFPDYGFDRHVGYGTAFHLKMLKKYGITPLHRLSYKPIKQLGLLRTAAAKV